MRQVFILVAALIATSLNLAPPARSSPAVSVPNGKVDLGWAWQGSLGTPFLAGSYDVPLGDHFGFEADALTGHVQGGDNYWGLGGQAFWRDPGVGLIGIGAARFRYDFLQTDRLQINGEVYLGDFTVSALGARDFVQISSFSLGHFDSATLSVGWYPDDNLLLQLGGDFQKMGNSATFHTEWQPNIGVAGLSAYADVTRDDASTGFLIGVRYYFGSSDKPLKARHREDDPQTANALQYLGRTKTLDDVFNGLDLARENGLTKNAAPGERRAIQLYLQDRLDQVVSDCRRGFIAGFDNGDRGNGAAIAGDFQICAAVLPVPQATALCLSYGLIWVLPTNPNASDDYLPARKVCTEIKNGGFQ